MCYFAEGDPAGGGGTPPPADPPAQDPPNDEPKFTQAELDKIVQSRLKAEQEKHAKKEAEATRKAELAKMDELERIKAEKEDILKQAQEKETLYKQLELKTQVLGEIGTMGLKIGEKTVESLLKVGDLDEVKAFLTEYKTNLDEAIKAGIQKQINPHKPKVASEGEISEDLKKAFGLK